MLENFRNRLEECASRVGSKVKLAEEAGISFSQLMRYMNGSSKPTVPSLMALANAASVTPAWLLSGQDGGMKKAGQVVLEKEIFLSVIKMVERALQNGHRQISSARKAAFIFFLCKAAEQLEAHEQDFLLSENALNDMLDFMTAYRDEELDELYTAIEQLPYEKDSLTVQRWVKLICRGHTAVYDTLAGRRYFERMLDVEGAYAQELKSVVNKVKEMNANLRDVLDLGCGNGRHLKFLHQQYPELNLKGLDSSENAIQICKNLESRDILPKGCVLKGNMAQLPYENASFDLIISRFTLMCIPMTSTHEGGLDDVFAEAKRVLRPGGILYAITQRGHGITFSAAHQLLDVSDMQNFAQRHGLDIVGLRLGETNIDLHKDPADKVHQTMSNYLAVQFVKPLGRTS